MFDCLKAFIVQNHHDRITLAFQYMIYYNLMCENCLLKYLSKLLSVACRDMYTTIPLTRTALLHAIFLWGLNLALV